MPTNPWSPQLQLSVCNFSISPYPFYLCNDDKCHEWPPCRTDPRPSATDRKLPKPRRGANQNQLWQRRYAIHNFLILWIHTHARKQKTDWSGNTIRSISSQRIQRTTGKKSSIQQPSWRKIDLLWLLRRKSLQATLMTVSIPRRRSASSAAAQQHFPAERIKLSEKTRQVSNGSRKTNIITHHADIARKHLPFSQGSQSLSEASSFAHRRRPKSRPSPPRKKKGIKVRK